MPAKTVTTAITEQLTNPTPTLPIDNSTAGMLAMAVAAFIAAGFQFRKMLSKSNLGADADANAQSMLALSREREKQAVEDARAAWDQLNKQNAELGELRARDKFHSEQIEEYKKIITEIRHGVQFVGQKVDAVKGRIEEASKTNSAVVPLNKE